MFWIDIHSHLDVEPLINDLENTLIRALSSNVKIIIVPGIWGAVRDYNFPNWVYKCFGVHPGICNEFTSEKIFEMFDKLNYKPIAIGEIGLDLIVNKNIEHQKEIFITQLELAKRLGLPVILHLRGGWNLALEILSTHALGIPWIFHSYCGTYEFTKQILKANRDAFFSFSGSVAFKNAKKTPLVAKNLAKNNILLETDSPDIRIPWWKLDYSEPCAIPEIAEYLAQLRNESISEISYYVKKNFSKIWQGIKEIKLE